jgi:hypothetical protein
MAAFIALDRLAEKAWKPETAAVLAEIRNILYLSSDFELAAELAGTLLD